VSLFFDSERIAGILDRFAEVLLTAR